MAQHTQRAIREGFLSLLNEVPFDKITVLDIAARCDINRNTFYYYYSDIYALVDDVLQTETSHIRASGISGSTLEDVTKQVMESAHVNRRIIMNLYNSQNRARLENYLYESFLAGLEFLIAKQAVGLRVREEDKHVLAVFYASALTGLTVKWIRGGMTGDAEGYIIRVSELLEGSLTSALRKSQS